MIMMTMTEWNLWIIKKLYLLFGDREYGRRDPSRWPHGTLYPQKLAITSPTSGGRSVGIVRSLTQTMEFSFFYYLVTSHEDLLL
jgi:hypothetical protein